MSGDETFAFIISVVGSIIGWVLWYRMALIKNFTNALPAKSLLWLWPLIMLSLLTIILLHYSADDVRNDIVYLIMYIVMGAAWIVGGMKCMDMLSISARDDVAERNNPAALAAVLGATTGITLAFAGGNIGNGPGWWVVVISSGIATISLMLSWVFINIIAPVADNIAIDRDTSCGWRMGIVLACIGVIAARGAAGDWVSVNATISDFWIVFWPVVPFLLLISICEKLIKPRVDDRVLDIFVNGIMPSVIYITLTFFYLRHVGWYE